MQLNYKKLFYLTSFVLSVLLLAILVYAYGGTNPNIHGHDQGELGLGPIIIDNQNSRVGIGTNSPSEKLEILSGNISIDSQYISEDTRLLFKYQGDGPFASIFRDDSEGDLYIRNDQGNDIILDNGNVGIGKANPGVKLDVAGTIKATSYSNLKPSFQRITATATIGSSATNTWIKRTSCPTGYTIAFWGMQNEIQYWGTVTHWYANCKSYGNGIEASLYTQQGYAGHSLTCFGICIKD